MRLMTMLVLLSAVPVAAGAKAPSLTVAVLYFDNLTSDPKYDVMKKGLADMMITDLAQVSGVVVVERARLQDVLTEQSLQATRFFDPATAVKTGKLIGASHVLTGTLTAVEPQLRLDVRLVDVKKATVLATSTISGRGDDLFELEAQLVERFVQALRLKGALPRPESAGPSAEALLQYSKGLEQADQGDFSGAQSTMAAVMQSAPGFKLAKTRYAELLGRVAAATERREVAMGSDEAALEARVLQAQARPVPADREQAALAFGLRVAGLELLLNRLRTAVDAEAASGATHVIGPKSRAAIGKLELAVVAAIDRLRADVIAHDREVPHVAPVKLANEDARLLGTLVKDRWLDASTVREGELRRIRAWVALGGRHYGYREYRPTAVERMPELFDVALAQAREAGGDSDFDTFLLIDEAAKALVRAGRKEDGVALWQRFLDAHPKSDKFKDAKRRIEDTLLVSADVAAGLEGIEKCAGDSMMAWSRVFDAVAKVERRPGVERLLKQIEKCAPKQGGLAMGWRVNGLGMASHAAAELGDCELMASLKKRCAALGSMYQQAAAQLATCR